MKSSIFKKNNENIQRISDLKVFTDKSLKFVVTNLYKEGTNEKKLSKMPNSGQGNCQIP